MRRRRTIYFNDARHYYLFIYEPPMTLEDAWRPVDEVAGTSVDTIAYGVARGDGLFYPSKVGKRFGVDMQPFESPIYWRVWESMQSLIERDLDPLRVLVDRAHDKGMDFFASFRMGTYDAVEPYAAGATGKRGLAEPEIGGRGLADAKARNDQFNVLQEIATQYPVEGLELDFASSPGGGPAYLRSEDVAEHTATLTEYIKSLSQMVRNRPGGPGQIGVRVYPTEEMNLAKGLDVREWLNDGLVDFVVPLMYLYLQLDPDMPIDWLVSAAHEADVSVYGMLQPYVKDESPDPGAMDYATPEMVRAASSNYWVRGVDGLYTWFMKWPMSDVERNTLTEMGDPDLIVEGDKHYVVRSRQEEAAELGYEAHLPLEVPSADPEVRYSLPVYISDDVAGAADRIRRVRLRIRVSGLLTADSFSVWLNGRSLSGESCIRDYGGYVRRPPSPHINEHYSAQWLEFELVDVRPRRGQNELEISLQGRPASVVGGITLQDVEFLVEYGPYSSGLR